MKSEYVLFVLLLMGCQTKSAESDSNAPVTDSSNVKGYNESANVTARDNLTNSAYTTDLKSVPDFERPDSSSIIDFPFRKSALFGIWTTDPDGPHADFVIDSVKFYIVDYDGDGAMPYKIHNRAITVYYHDFIEEGWIEKVSADTLTIKWSDIEQITHYVRWTN